MTNISSSLLLFSCIFLYIDKLLLGSAQIMYSYNCTQLDYKDYKF